MTKTGVHPFVEAQEVTIPSSVQTNPIRIDPFGGGGAYVSAARLFFLANGNIPSIEVMIGIDAIKMRDYLMTNWSQRICQRFDYAEQLISRKSEILNWETILQLDTGIWLSLEEGRVYWYYDTPQKMELNEMLELTAKFRKRAAHATHIYLVSTTPRGYDLTGIQIKKPRLKIQRQYNADLEAVHPQLLKMLRTNQQSGLYLFYGPPGTGKSTYIRYLIRSIQKPTIFISPAMAAQLDGPDLTRLLIQHPDAVYVIEDAEHLLRSRRTGNDSRISTLLNLTDGLIGSCLGTQFIASFNCDLQEIDPALLRTGRLQLLYEFKPLEPTRTQALMQELYPDTLHEATEMTLAEIYHYRKTPFIQPMPKRAAIGFRAVS